MHVHGHAAMHVQVPAARGLCTGVCMCTWTHAQSTSARDCACVRVCIHMPHACETFTYHMHVHKRLTHGRSHVREPCEPDMSISTARCSVADRIFRLWRSFRFLPPDILLPTEYSAIAGYFDGGRPEYSATGGVFDCYHQILRCKPNILPLAEFSISTARYSVANRIFCHCRIFRWRQT